MEKWLSSKKQPWSVLLRNFRDLQTTGSFFRKSLNKLRFFGIGKCWTSYLTVTTNNSTLEKTWYLLSILLLRYIHLTFFEHIFSYFPGQNLSKSLLNDYPLDTGRNLNVPLMFLTPFKRLMRIQFMSCALEIGHWINKVFHCGKRMVFLSSCCGM